MCFLVAVVLQFARWILTGFRLHPFQVDGLRWQQVLMIQLSVLDRPLNLDVSVQNVLFELVPDFFCD